jgi:hypothetical protein
MMTLDQHIPRTSSVSPAEQSARASGWSALTAWIRACGNAYVASAIYEDLSRLSDAELQRRGLSRENLARDAFKSCEHRD